MTKTTVKDVTGESVGEVSLGIDYAIIQHFSKNLYGSPTKAVEELVANSFDALATVAYVYVAGPQVADRLVVWDDGISMGIKELQGLWVIAKSPKDDGSDRVAKNDQIEARKLIGKFGIGKLASYQLGHRISHLCKTNGEYLLVTIDFRDIISEDETEELAVEGKIHEATNGTAPELPSGEEAEPAAPETNGTAEPPITPEEKRAPIIKLDAEAAREWATKQFSGKSEALDALWDKDTWTIAVVDELRTDSLPPGRLRWNLGRSMPLRPDFAIKVNDKAVESKFLKGTLKHWDLAATEVKQALSAEWKKAKDDGRVKGELTFRKSDTEGGAPKAVFPELGAVTAEIGLFGDSLIKTVAADHGRSHGFFVMVRDRLLNPDDAQLLLKPPSFGAFYRSQFVLRVDGLDVDLLADRERLHKETPRMAELSVLQMGLYLAARNEIEKLDEKAEADSSSEALLPLASRPFFRDPVTALLLETDHGDQAFDLGRPRIDRQNLEPSDSMAILDIGKSSFFVNSNHPFFSSVADRLGSGKKAREMLRALDLIAVSERLLEGHLLDIGLERGQVSAVLEWRDGLLRDIARQYNAASESAIADVMESSYTGDKVFEDAIAELFRLMGFEAVRDGANGKKDVLVVAPIGADQFKFTAEGKGSKDGPLSLDDAEVAGAAEHRDEVPGATHAVVIAREFAGFKKDPEGTPKLLKQCKTVGGVSIVTVEALVALYEAAMRFFYPLEKLLPILAEVEAPATKLKRISDLQSPMDAFDYRQLLEEIWSSQKGVAAGDVVPYRNIWQTSWKETIDFDTFELKLTALETLSGGLVRMEATKGQVVRMLQSPAVVAEAIAANLGA